MDQDGPHTLPAASPRVGTCKGRGARQAEPAACVDQQRTIHAMLLQHGLLVFDIGFNRIPRASFQPALVRRGHNAVTDEDSVGKPAKVDILFCRDPIDEADHPENYTTHPGSHTTHGKSYATPSRQPLSLGQFIKLMIVYELHGLNDIAVDTLERFADRLNTRSDCSSTRIAGRVRCAGSFATRGGRCGGGCVVCKERRNRPKFSPAQLSSRLILDRETGAAAGGQVLLDGAEAQQPQWPGAAHYRTAMHKRREPTADAVLPCSVTANPKSAAASSALRPHPTRQRPSRGNPNHAP